MRSLIDLFENTEMIRDSYLRGRCMVLANALSEKYGWTPRPRPRHIAVVRPDGNFADARGISLSREEFLQGYRANAEIHAITFDMKSVYQRDWEIGDDLRILGLNN